MGTALASLTLVACGGGSGGGDDDDMSPAVDAAMPTSANLARVKPPVEAVTPAGFKSGTKPASHLLNSMDFKTRFFEPGPTSVFLILDNVDGLINDYNTRSAAMVVPCVTQAPVNYMIEAFGQPLAMSAQCFEQNGGRFDQFGVVDGTTYVFHTNPVGRVAAIVTADQADVYMAFGGDEDFGVGGYGAIQIHADGAAGTFEMSVAGMGLGYCGAQLSSNGTSVYGIGSIDMGTTCNAVDTLCVNATDLTTVGACDDIDAIALPALGRIAVGNFGGSQYPDPPNMTFDGTPTDDHHFGPDAPTAGVGAFTMPQ